MNQELVTVYFMWRRELIRFFRSKSRIVGSLGQPFFFLAILGTGLNGAMRLAGVGGNYMEFIVPGILASVLLFGSIFSGIIVIMDRQFGFLKETLVAPVNRTSIVVGKSLGGATTAIVQGFLMMVMAVFLGATIDFTTLPFVILLMALISMAFVSLGIVFGSVMEDMHGFQLITNFLVMPMFFLSGALFPLSTAPQIVQYVSLIDPLTYAVEALRFFLVGSSSIPLSTCLAVLFGFFALTTAGAAYFFSRIES
jgi:ABC-2 type transport system permease protein